MILCLGFSTILCGCFEENNNESVEKQLVIQGKEIELGSIQNFSNINVQAISKIKNAFQKETINEVFEYNKVKYIDYTKNNIRFIIEYYENGDIYKYLLNADVNGNNEIYKNEQNNIKLCDIQVVKKDDMLSYERVIDPITISSQYIFPYTGKETYREEVDSQLIITLNETFDSFEIIDASYIKIISNTNIPELALFFHVSIKTITEWLESVNLPINNDNIILSDFVICTNKKIKFRYGREIFMIKSNDDHLLYDIWEDGVIKYDLEMENLIKAKNECIKYQIIDMPKPLTLCNEYYRDLAINILANL